MRFLTNNRFSGDAAAERCHVKLAGAAHGFYITPTSSRDPKSVSLDRKMSRNKSIIRSSSTSSYPYPRTHTTLMVIPTSKRPPSQPSSPSSSQGSTAASTSSSSTSTSFNKNIRRRPPLNRACPPIPESKSNESIMSHASRISEKQSKAVADSSIDLVIENRNVVNVLHCLDSNSNIAQQQRGPINNSLKKKKMSNTPRSPLMSVAHSVKNKLTKITQLGRSSDGGSGAASSSSSIKISKSFSGIRQPKTIPKRIDQNANRVIKSSSMEVPSTSKTIIPQDAKPLNDDKIEEVSEAGLIPKSEIASPSPPIVVDPVCHVKLEEDVLVVTKEFDERYPGQKRSASPDAPLLIVESFEIQQPAKVDVILVEKFDANANPPPVDITVDQEHRKEDASLELTTSPEPIIEAKDAEPTVDEELTLAQESFISPERVTSPEKFTSPEKVVSPERVTSPEKYVLTVKTPEALQKHRTLTIGDKDPEAVVEEEVVRKKIKKPTRSPSMPERVTSPERYILTVKTPEALRKHRTLTIGTKDPEAAVEEEVVQKKIKKPIRSPSMPERVTSPERYILTVKTPEALRKHRTLTIGDKDPEAVVDEVENEKPKKIKRPIRSPSMPERVTSPERYILTVKTPEALRKHRTLTIGDKEPSALVEEEIVQKKIKKPMRSPSMPERVTSPERYVLTVRTPEALRKHRTLTICDKDPEAAVEEEVVQKKIKKPMRSPSMPERVTSPERYILSVKTPEALRKHRTLTIGDKDPEAAVEEEVVQKKIKKPLRSPSMPERVTSPERYVLTVKTPEALRRHRTFTIGDRDPEAAAVEEEQQVPKKIKKPIKSPSMPERVTSPERYILTVKTPEALRKHQTLTIGEKEPEEAQEEVQIMRIETVKVKELKMETKDPLEDLRKEAAETATKYVMVMKTPECLRRHHTFTIGDRPKSPDYPFIEEGEITEPIATIGPPAERRKREEEKVRKRKEWEEYDRPQERFILTTSATQVESPKMIRKCQTFMVENRDATTDVLPASISADAELSSHATRKEKKKKMQRSESTDSKKHSYLRRLQFELFRGRSRERKADRDEKRQKSLDERTPGSAQKYVLSTTTPVMMRKYQTFAIVDNNNTENPASDYNIESIESSYIKPKEEDRQDEEKVRPSDFYSITATTPVAKRRNQVVIDPEISSPPSIIESRHLFVMSGRRSTTPRCEDRKQFLRLDTLDRSQSDRAEVQEGEERKSTLSGDLTSPEEDIPMDTNLTPTADDDVPIISRRIGMTTASPIEEEPEGLLTSMSLSLRSPDPRPAPVFTPPSPPPPMTSSADASTNTSGGAKKPNQLAINPMHIVELKPKDAVSSSSSDEAKSKSKKDPKIASRSLRNAGKMLTPSFLRKDRNKNGDKKKSGGYTKTTTTGRQHIVEKKASIERMAPLAEGESSVVANSPLVENLPITYEKWSVKSPRQSVRHFGETIVEEAVQMTTTHPISCGPGLDANANVSSSNSAGDGHNNQQTNNVSTQETGLIDDDILDQPMLVGDTFSHSSSIDCLSAHQKKNESIISIDRSVAAATSELRNGEKPASNLTRQIDVGLSEVEDIKSQLQRLNKLVNEMGVSNWEDELIRLRRENQQLRHELAIRDATIATLRSQAAAAVIA